MLARSFLSHQRLGITEEEHRALVQVLGMFERGEIMDYEDWFKETVSVRNNRRDARVARDKFVDKQIFRMSETCDRTSCGTIACIGGWAAYAMGMDPGESHNYVMSKDTNSGPIYDLYFGYILDRVTPEQGRQALTNFLTTGNPDWIDIMGWR